MEAQRWRQHPHEFAGATYVETVDRPDLTELPPISQEINLLRLGRDRIQRGPRVAVQAAGRQRRLGGSTSWAHRGVDFSLSPLADSIGQSSNLFAAARVSAGSAW